jgi:hypothetical protein
MEAAMAARIQPSDEQLRAAWLRAKRWTWPASYEEAMADPVRAAIVHGYAVRIELRAQRPEPAREPQQPRLLVRARTVPAEPLKPRQPALFDRKRAAAGEHEEE